jgi:hypothetical protein
MDNASSHLEIDQESMCAILEIIDALCLQSATSFIVPVTKWLKLSCH